ncbi:nucleotidyltransferase domain-containing protein [Burkholderia vietnamiensis]|uniref:nucleotidyltransferase domain-containing protein n=1 Tax=Burkholderia vietnamiensis TaxID=60552 RepID=UPI001592E7FF|nr:nucleotidyltransferase domain-containing protein [Burkholderia vietnamiensis]
MSLIGDALFSRAQQPLLALIFGRPEVWFHVNELIRLTGLSSASVQRELSRLEQGGLIESRRVGNLKQVRAFEAGAIFQELRAIVLKSFGATDVLRDALAQLAAQIPLAFVYGSVAQGRDHTASDIDVMVISDSISNGQLLAALEPAESRLGRPIHGTLYTVGEFADRYQRQHYFLTDVLQQPKLFVIGAAHDVERLGKSGPHPQAENRRPPPGGV